MSQSANKYKGKSKYEGVYIRINSVGVIEYFYLKSINGIKFRGTFSDEIECARQYDLVLIKNGLEPINILRRK